MLSSDDLAPEDAGVEEGPEGGVGGGRGEGGQPGDLPSGGEEIVRPQGEEADDADLRPAVENVVEDRFEGHGVVKHLLQLSIVINLTAPVKRPPAFPAARPD